MKISKKFYFLACILCISVCESIAMNDKSHALEFCKDWIKKEEEKNVFLKAQIRTITKEKNDLVEKCSILTEENKNLKERYNSYLVIDLRNHPIKVWTGTGLLIFSVISVALGSIEIRFK